MDEDEDERERGEEDGSVEEREREGRKRGRTTEKKKFESFMSVTLDQPIRSRGADSAPSNEFLMESGDFYGRKRQRSRRIEHELQSRSRR